MTRSRLLLAIILTAVAVLFVSLWVSEGPLWRISMLEWVEGSREYPHRPYGHVIRWGEKAGRKHGLWLDYHMNGFLKEKAGYRYGLSHGLRTRWNELGWVTGQDSHNNGRPVDLRSEPPWWDGVSDQTEPTAPWWEEEKAKRMEREKQ